MTRMLVVATVAPTIRGFLLPFAEHYRRLGWRVDALADGVSQCESCRAGYDHVWDMNWSRNPLAPKNMLTCRRQVRQLVEREGYDLVHVHTPVAAFVTRFALRWLRRQERLKIVYTAHGFHFHSKAPAWKNAIFEGFERLAGRWTDRLVVMNEDDLQAARRARIVPDASLTYMPGIGVDTQALTAQSVASDEVATVRNELGLSDEDAYLLVVAELIPRKRHADILHAFANLQDRGETTLVLAGDGPLLDELKQLAKSLGVASRVQFLGFRKDIPALMRGCQALILASTHEGLPRSVMEAMCMEVPVIGSDIRGTRDLLKDGAGLLFPLGGIDELTGAMRTALSDPKTMSKLAECSRERIDDYDISRVIEMHDALYAGLISDPALGAD